MDECIYTMENLLGDSRGVLPGHQKKGSDSYVNGLREEAIWKKYKYEDRRSEVKVREKNKGQVKGLVGLPRPDN